MEEVKELESGIRGGTVKFLRNSFLSVGRLLVSTLVAVTLPAILTKWLSVETYSAWVLILQMSAYVSYLDFGIQSGVSKYVAEYEAKADPAGSSVRASAGFVLMLGAGVIGIGLTGVLALLVPRLFTDMPQYLYWDARIALLFVGVSLSIGLICSVFSSIFIGQQKYAIPIGLQVINRIFFAAVVLLAVRFHKGLIIMGGLVAIVNIATGALQVEAWRRSSNHVRIKLKGLELGVLSEMVSYCSTLAIWSAGMLCVSGLDVAIVGHYDFRETAFYSIATQPTAFTVSALGAALAPLIPTISSLSVHSSPRRMGSILSTATRYSSILLFLTAIPWMVCGYWILHLWVGDNYAVHTLPYLRILILANVIRGVCAPYASMLVATNTQRVAIAGVVLEAAVNVASSVFLAERIGAIGVAYGTLIGSTISIAMHSGFNIRRTYSTFAISRVTFFLASLARPGMIALPSIVLIQLWWLPSAPQFGSLLWVGWSLSTALLAWYICLNEGERYSLLSALQSRLKSH